MCYPKPQLYNTNQRKSKQLAIFLFQAFSQKMMESNATPCWLHNVQPVQSIINSTRKTQYGIYLCVATTDLSNVMLSLITCKGEETVEQPQPLRQRSKQSRNSSFERYVLTKNEQLTSGVPITLKHYHFFVSVRLHLWPSIAKPWAKNITASRHKHRCKSASSLGCLRQYSPVRLPGKKSLHVSQRITL